MRSIVSTKENKTYQKTSWVNTSSACFLVLKDIENNIRTEISFLNHFLLKRNIQCLNLRMRLFDLGGQLYRDWTEKVCEPRVYVFDPCAEIDTDNFCGSIVINFESSDNLGVPFSAVVGTIIASNSVCAVHSYGRELEAFEVGGKLDVDETHEAGWTVRDNDEVSSFAAMHNGSTPAVMKIKLQVMNMKNETLETNVEKKVGAYETLLVQPKEFFNNLPEFLGNEPGHAWVSIKGVKRLFPRMMCGNFAGKSLFRCDELQFTHTNFDFDRIGQPLAANNAAFFNSPHLPDAEFIIYPFKKSRSVTFGVQRLPERQIFVSDVFSSEMAVKSNTDELPSRVVGASIGNWPNAIVPSECSTGIYIADYLDVPGFWHWGQIKPSVSGHSVLTIFRNNFESRERLELKFVLKLYSTRQLIKEVPVSVCDTKHLDLREILDVTDFNATTLWFSLTGPGMEEVNVFNTFIPAEQNAGYAEHAF